MTNVVTTPSRPHTSRTLNPSDAMTVNFDLRFPTVVALSQKLEHLSDTHEAAVAMESARYSLEGYSAPFSTPNMPTEINVTDKYAFAFDIDGVLIRGGRPIPEAIEAMKVLNGRNKYGIKIPYIFVTNGGGKTEQERCIQLSKQMETEVSPGQFICGHTPLREMASRYNTVLVVGGDGEKCREVAEGYAFRDVVTPGDIIKDNSDTTPFRKLSKEEWSNSRERDFSKTVIEAIFVFADSRDWAGDQQIVLDLLMSKGGIVGTRSENFDEGPPIFFSHNDVVWSASHNLTRLGMGALRISLEAIFEAVTSRALETVAFGKPQMATFQFAARLLQQWRKNAHGIDAPPETVYFVGDTPESDICGTNEYNEQSENTWYSILVRTGVFKKGSKPKYTPNHTAEHVLDAVFHGIEREQEKQLRNSLNTSAKLERIVVNAAPSTPIVVNYDPVEKAALQHATGQVVD